MSLLHQVNIAINFTPYFVNLCIDILTEAIYRAYDDNADISEYFCLILFIGNFDEIEISGLKIINV